MIAAGCKHLNETKVAGSGAMASSRKSGQGSLWTLTPAEEELV
jgi:hypothetical protein